MTLRITLLVLVTGLFSLVWIQDRQSLDVADSEIPLHIAKADPTPKLALRKTEASPEFENRQRMTARDSADAIRRQVNVVWKRSYRRTGIAVRQWTKKQIAAFSQGFRDWAAEITRRSRMESAPLQMVSAMTRAEKKKQRGTESDMPLPAEIVPGEYRAVSNTGVVRHLTLSLDQLQNRGRRDFEARDVYRSQGPDLRWYFIRVMSADDPILPAMAETGRDPISPAMAEKCPASHRPAVAESSLHRGIEKQAGKIILQSGTRVIRRMSAILENRNEAAEKMKTLLKSPLRTSQQETDKDRL